MEPKPTYEEQLDWLETIKLLNPEMIKAIKENVIAVRNYEKALEKELEQPERKKILNDAFYDLLEFGETIMPPPTEEELAQIQKLVTKGKDVELDCIEAYAEGKQDIEAYKKLMLPHEPSPNSFINIDWSNIKPFVFRADELNPREESIINNRIKQLQGELRSQLALKKQFRNHAEITNCHKSINNLKLWLKP